jgi:DnaK suppressor protein
MDKKTLSELKKKLEQERTLLEKDLLKFTDKDKNIPDDYDTRFPDLGGRSAAPDEDAKETEMYENLLAVEYALEIRLKEVNESLEKIKENDYGHCEICKGDIQLDRLRANAAAKTCITCNNKNNLQKNK